MNPKLYTVYPVRLGAACSEKNARHRTTRTRTRRQRNNGFNTAPRGTRPALLVAMARLEKKNYKERRRESRAHLPGNLVRQQEHHAEPPPSVPTDWNFKKSVQTVVELVGRGGYGGGFLLAGGKRGNPSDLPISTPVVVVIPAFTACT